MAEYVKKRNGRMERFDRKKLSTSIHLSARSAATRSRRLEERVVGEAARRLSKRTVTSEDIRSAVCAALKKYRHHEVCDFYSLVWLRAKPVKVRRVIKRNGRREKFSPEKLFRSVQKSFKAAYEHDGEALGRVMQDALRMLNKKYRGKDVTTGEIKDLTEYVLIKRKLVSVAKHYIMYRYV